ncbi:MAG: hypothetical protein H0V18_15550 [Pyrinomonadaceae bacterium]|nr:hypothetical protein [Pyrinomonadaceae bacterium]
MFEPRPEIRMPRRQIFEGLVTLLLPNFQNHSDLTKLAVYGCRELGVEYFVMVRVV